MTNPPSRPLSLILTGLAVAGLALLPACSKSDKTAAKPAATAKSGLETVEQRVSYGIGYNMGAGIARQGGFTPDQVAMRAGIEDGLAGAKTRIPETDLEAAFTTLQQRMAKIGAEAAVKNEAAAKAYLEKNKSRPGVKVTPSGLQYEVVARGLGPKAKSTDTVVVRYNGTLIDGTVFDSSIQRGETAEFPVTGVIPGWTEALQLMSAGDKFKLYIPPALGYGPRAAGKIPPNSLLIFDVELVKIK